MRARVIVSDEHGAARIAHDLFRDAILASVPAARRAHLHAATGRALLDLAGGAGVHDLSAVGGAARLAAHFMAAGPAYADEARRYSVAAAQEATARLGHDDAAVHYENALRLGPRTAPRTSSCCSPWRPRGIAPVTHPPHAASTREQPRRPGPPPTPPRWPGPRWACMTWAAAPAPTSARSPTCSPKPPTASPHEPPDRAAAALRSRVLAALARTYRHATAAPVAPQAHAAAAEAVELAGTADDPATLAIALLAAHDVAWRPGSAAERLKLATAMADAAAALGRPGPGRRGHPAARRCPHRTRRPGRPGRTRRLHRTGRQPRPRPRSLAGTEPACHGGRDGRSRRRGDRPRRRRGGTRRGHRHPGRVRLPQHAARLVGRPRRARTSGRRAAARHRSAVADVPAAARLERPLQRSAGAGRRVDARLRRPRHRRIATTWSCWPPPPPYAPRSVPPSQQQWLYDQLAPHAGTHVVVGGCAAYHGAVDHLLGRLAAAQGHLDQAAQHFTAAIEMHDRLGTPAWGELSRRARESLAPADVFRRDGDTWQFTFDGRSAHLADAKGLHDIALLLRSPGQDVHVFTLLGVDTPATGADPVPGRAGHSHLPGTPVGTRRRHRRGRSPR